MKATRNRFRTRFPKHAAAALLLLTFSTSPTFGKPGSAQSISDFFVGHAAPDFKLKDLDGHDVELSSFKGNIVLIDFWATWCGPCRAEIPMIEHIWKGFEKKNVIVIGINSEEPEGVVRKFVAKNKMTYRIALTEDNPSVIHAYGARGLPTVAIIDKNGIIAAYRVGENPNTEEILRDDIHRVSSSKYVAPQPKLIQMAQIPPAVSPAPMISAAGPDPNWQPKTAEEFLARGYARLRIHKNPQAEADAEDALKLRPDWFMALFLHGRAAYEQKDYSTAIEDFNKVIQQKPDWAQGYHYRGLAYSYQGQHQQALPDYQKVLELTPYLAVAYNDQGWALRELSQFDKAKANLDKAIEMEPDYIRARENRAILFGKQSDWVSELNELTMILELMPNDQWAKDAKEAALQKRQSPVNAQKQPSPELTNPDVQPKLVSKIEPEYTEEARRAGVSAVIFCSLIVNADGVPQDIRVLRGAGFGLDENAIRAVSAWRFEPATKQGAPVACTAHVEVNFRLLVSNHDHQFASLNFTLPAGCSRPELSRGKVPDNPKGASDAKLRVALTVDPDGKLKDVSILESTPTEWAEAAMREMKNWRFRPASINGRPAEVKGILELVRASTGFLPSGPAVAAHNAPEASVAWGPGPDPSWQPKTAEEFLARGYARLRTHKYPEAKADAEDALKLRPDSVAAWYLHGRAAYDAKEYSTAIDDFDKVIHQRPDWPDAHRYRGLAYSYYGQQQHALPDYQKAIELDPHLAPAYNGLGWAYSELGQFALARTNLDKAIELEPDFILARENRAKLLAKQGDFHAEQNELAIILGLSPNDQWAKDSKEAVLQKLR